MTPDRIAALERWMSLTLKAEATTVSNVRSLSGGAIQENWAIDAEISGGPLNGKQYIVLKADAASAVRESRSRLEEFRVLQLVYAAGISVPEPLAACTDVEIIGSPFFLMRRANGFASGHELAKSASSEGLEGLAVQLAVELAGIHAIDTEQSVLIEPAGEVASALVARVELMRHQLSTLPNTYPALEWGLRWLDLQQLPILKKVICHRDFRTGNYLVNRDSMQLSAILDWEFAGLSDFHEDLGWFCASCWRFGNQTFEAGGIAKRHVFIQAYEKASGRRVDKRLLHAWEVVAHVRWALIAIDQAARHLSGTEPSLMLALTGLLVPELELEVLEMTES